MIKSTRSYHFINMTKPLVHPVKCGSKIVIPVGAENVKIAFRQSHLTYLNKYTGKTEHMNVYLWKGKLYHA